MAVSALSGTSGALYYKPAGSKGTFGTANVVIATETITVETYLNFKVGDPVKFSVINSQTGGSGTGTLPAGLTTSDTFYVIAYTATTGALQVSATSGGSAVNVLETLNNTAKTNSGVFLRIGTISGPDFSTTETPPLFEGRIDTSYIATDLD